MSAGQGGNWRFSWKSCQVLRPGIHIPWSMRPIAPLLRFPSHLEWCALAQSSTARAHLIFSHLAAENKCCLCRALPGAIGSATGRMEASARPWRRRAHGIPDGLLGAPALPKAAAGGSTGICLRQACRLDLRRAGLLPRADVDEHGLLSLPKTTGRSRRACRPSDNHQSAPAQDLFPMGVPATPYRMAPAGASSSAMESTSASGGCQTSPGTADENSGRYRG